MRTAVLFVLLAAVPAAQARVKTPKSANARAQVQTHKAHGKHAARKIKTNRSKRTNHPRA